MKKILFFAFALRALTATAQQGIFVKPFAGAGTSGIREMPLPRSSFKNEPIPSFIAGVNVGYAWKNWRFESGLQYLTTGKQMNNLLMEESFSSGALIPVSFTIMYQHIQMPLTALYDVRLNKKWSLQPGAGLAVTYNASVASTIRYQNTGRTISSKQNTDIGNSLHRFSLFGNMQASAIFHASNKISIFAGPGVQYMITSIARKPAFATKDYKQRHYAATLSAGVIWQL